MTRLMIALLACCGLTACRPETPADTQEPAFDRKALMFAIRDNDAETIATLSSDTTTLRIEQQTATLPAMAFRAQLDSFLRQHPVQRFYEMETTPEERRRGLDLSVWFTDGKDDYKMLFDLKSGRIESLEIRRL